MKKHMFTTAITMIVTGVLLAGCGSDGFSASEMETEIRPSLESQLYDRDVVLDSLDCIKTESGGLCIADVSDEMESAKIDITVTKGEDGEYIWSVD